MTATAPPQPLNSLNCENKDGFEGDSESLEVAVDPLPEALIKLRASTKYCLNASQVEARHPQLYHLVCSLLVAGMAPAAIAEGANMSVRTVLALRARADAQGVIENFRDSYIAKLRALMTIGSDELLTKFQAGKVSALDLKLLCDQHELLSGNATVRVSHTEDPEISELRQAMQQQIAQRLAATTTALSDRVKIGEPLTIEA